MRKRLSPNSRGVSSFFSFVGGFLMCLLLVQGPAPLPPQSPDPVAPNVIKQDAPIAQDDLSFVSAWRHATETCQQWITIQRSSNSYLDAYVVGSQKGATSQLSKHLFDLGVRHRKMIKEWHFYNQLDEYGNVGHGRFVARPLPPLNLSQLRLLHYLTGFPHSDATSSSIPLIEQGPLEKRRITIDMTVEYLHSDRSAFLAHTLTPHAKIVITIRDPLERALSQYNMNMRNGNKRRRKLGQKDKPATAEEFDTKIRQEIDKLQRCGYNADAATLDRRTSELVACMFHNSNRDHFDDAFYVMRGLYHLHIRTWRDHFPAHRILILSFQDMSLGRRQMYNDLTDFLCIRRFPDDLLNQYEAHGSTLSFGQQAAEKGLKKAGFDSYVGNDRYLPTMLDETRTALQQFYAAADSQLKAMLGEHYVYWATAPEESQEGKEQT